jgi:prepilin-type N-terminal cleavage/methylation domain-containing protein
VQNPAGIRASWAIIPDVLKIGVQISTARGSGIFMGAHVKNKGFTLIELLIVVVIVGILALAAIPLIASNTEEARSSEARASLGALKDRARVVYQRTPGAIADVAALGVAASELGGSYFTDANYTFSSTAAGACTGTCTGVYSAAPTSLILTGSVVTGSSGFNR